MKIIFLDIDGPVNNVRTMYAFPGEYNKRFDPVAVGLLNDLIEESGAKVVLSSTWRKLERKMADALQFMKDAGYKYDFLDRTPNSDNGCRGQEIKAWLKDHPEVTHYCIIDDDSDMLLEQMPHFVKVPGHNGITYENYYDAQRILECGNFAP